MKYFKKDGKVYAFDETQDDLITDEFTPMTDEEVEAHLALTVYEA